MSFTPTQQFQAQARARQLLEHLTIAAHHAEQNRPSYAAVAMEDACVWLGEVASAMGYRLVEVRKADAVDAVFERLSASALEGRS